MRKKTVEKRANNLGLDFGEEKCMHKGSIVKYYLAKEGMKVGYYKTLREVSFDLTQRELFKAIL